MALRILSSDVIDFEVRELIVNSDQFRKPIAVPDSAITRTHTRGGAITMTGTMMPGMVLADLHWQTAEAIIMEDRTPSVNININFVTQGSMLTQFSGLGHELDMQPGRHNLVYAPESSDSHQIREKDNLEMLHISMEREHFRNLLTGAGNSWCDRILRDLEAERPFSGIKGTGAITPAMQQAILGIRCVAPSGPLRHLQLQSRTAELLALQIEQFMTAADMAPADALSATDEEKLAALKLYLDAHFLDELSLSQLARVSLLNEFKLKKGFKQLYGTTVFGYLKDLRMRHAALLLRDRSMMIDEVAELLGYEHAHHFSSAFKKHYGYTPSEWSGRKG